MPIKQTNELYLNLFFSIPNTLQFNISATEGGFKEHPAVDNKDIVICAHSFRFSNVFKKAPDARLHPVGFGSNISTKLLVISFHRWPLAYLMIDRMVLNK